MQTIVDGFPLSQMLDVLLLRLSNLEQQPYVGFELSHGLSPFGFGKVQD